MDMANDQVGKFGPPRRPESANSVELQKTRPFSCCFAFGGACVQPLAEINRYLGLEGCRNNSLTARSTAAHVPNYHGLRLIARFIVFSWM